jgi:CarD family transcriptional regulator
MFTTGDKVVHPGHGPGVVKGVESRRLLGEEKQYYVIEMLASSATLMTPVAKADEVGLRPALSGVSLGRLFDLLADEPAALSDDFRERQTRIEERLRDGDVFATARVIRDLMWHAQVQGLTKRDAQLMQRAEDLVAAELALVEDIEIETALDRVQAVVEAAISEGEVESTH